MFNLEILHNALIQGVSKETSGMKWVRGLTKALKIKEIKIFKFERLWEELQIYFFTQTIADKIYEKMSKNPGKVG